MLRRWQPTGANGLPSGELTKSNGKIHHFSWENPLFLWPFSIAMLVHQRVTETQHPANISLTSWLHNRPTAGLIFFHNLTFCCNSDVQMDTCTTNSCETLSMTAHSNFGVEFTTTGPGHFLGALVLLGRWWWRWRGWGTLTFGCLEQGLVVVDLVHRVWNQSNFLRLHYWVAHWALVVLLQGGCEDRMPGWKIAGRTVGPVLLQHAHARSNAEGRDILAWMLVRHGETWTLGGSSSLGACKSMKGNVANPIMTIYNNKN